MSRTARKKSSSGFYHIMMRGNGRQNIYIDDDDRKVFIDRLIRYKEDVCLDIHAYCLMSNHTHILLNDPNDELDVFMKKLTVSYVYYFNHKYDRIGALFQDRFKSEPIEDDSYFLTVLRYIHRNPLKARITENLSYRWSSHNEYVSNAKFTATGFALKLLGGVDAYMNFMQKEDEAICLDITHSTHPNEKAAYDIIKRLAHPGNIQDIPIMQKRERDVLISKAKKEGLSVRQIARITGLGRGIVLQTGSETDK